MERAELERQLESLHPRSFAWALTACRFDQAEAEETLQATYLKVLEGRAHFDGRSSLKTWLFGVIRRTATERRRRSFFRLAALGALLLRGEEPPPAPMPLQNFEEAEQRLRMRALLLSLPRRQREVLELVFYQELTIEDSARVMHISLGSARVHYTRGKQRLLERLRGGVHELA